MHSVHYATVRLIDLLPATTTTTTTTTTATNNTIVP